jgi:hypothetical protein
MRYRCSSVVVAALLALLVVPSPARAQNERAVLDQVLALYKTHDVVLLGEAHDRRLQLEFRLALLRHPRFASTVQDIYIECANSLYQEVLDDFVLRLQDVPAEKLRMVWRNTTQTTGVWDSPIYEEFIRAVRSVNASLGRDRRIRLVAGDPPIDWAVIHSPEQAMPFFLQRDESAYTAIEKESLQKHRKALVIYGGAHLFSRSYWSLLPMPLQTAARHSIGSYLREKYPGRAYTVIALSAVDSSSVNEFQTVTGTRAAPILLEVGGAELARLPANKFFGRTTGDAPVGDLMDAVLYLGAGDEIVRPTADVVNDTVYQTELKRRRELEPGLGQLMMKAPAKKQGRAECRARRWYECSYGKSR